MKAAHLKLKLFIVPVLLCLFFFSSCDSNRIFEENRKIPTEGWSSGNILKFDVDITNLVIPTNFFINVRNADGYPYNNLFLFVKTTFPDGKIADDTLECILADEKGKWLGTGMGDIYDNQIPFKKNVRFPVAGIYKFEMQQGMRSDVIPLIMDVGLRIEKTEN